ncbi:MAG: hypothetical protein C0391_07215 [Anaerolinea sp.]|nr:hypothetical protein [Anaerolinea sp.]
MIYNVSPGNIGKKTTILVIDDDVSFLFGISRLLAKADFNVIAATEGISGIARAQAGHPDLILMDINLPNMTGFQVKKALESDSHTQLIPVVFLTTINDNSEINDGFSSENEYITKPVDTTILAARIKSILHKTKTANLPNPLAEIDQTTSFDRFKQWAYSVEMLDERAIGHTCRVANLTLALARSLGIVDEQMLDNIYKGAFLHDIGKLAISERVLNKPGPLNDEEWDLMRHHPTVAYDMLASIDLLKDALDIPHCHHERWDGLGYPNRLAGKEIPLAARIFSVVDVYDALTSKRPYKEAQSETETLKVIHSLSGKQFDPAIVENFLENFEALKKWAFQEPE